MTKIIVGQDPFPRWLWDKTEVFRTWDGDVGYEIVSSVRSVHAHLGDVICVDGDRITVSKNKQEQHQEQQFLA